MIEVILLFFVVLGCCYLMLLVCVLCDFLVLKMMEFWKVL